MNCAYVCTSCRQRLNASSNRQGVLNWIQKNTISTRASARSLNSDQGQPSSECFQGYPQDVPNLDRQATASGRSLRTSRRAEYQQPGSVQDQFLERLFKGRVNVRPPGPYSSARLASGKRHSPEKATLGPDYVSVQLHNNDADGPQDEQHAALRLAGNDSGSTLMTIDNTRCKITTQASHRSTKSDRDNVRIWCLDPSGNTGIRPYSYLRKTPPRHASSQYWANLLWTILPCAVMTLREDPSGVNKCNPNIVTELMLVWTQFFHAYSAQKSDLISEDESANDIVWIALGKSEKMQDIKSWFSRDFHRRFSHFLLGDFKGQFQLFGTAALTTFVVLNHSHLVRPGREISSSDVIPNNQIQFVHFIAQLVSHSNILDNSQPLERILGKYCSAVEDKNAVISRLEEIVSKSVILGSIGCSGAQLKEDSRITVVAGQASTHLGSEMVKKRIARCMEDRNIGRLEALWEDIHTSNGGGNETASGRGLAASLYSHFLVAFMGLKRPNRAIDIWNSMVEDGITPTVSTWNAMLKGCGIARDPKALENVWLKMLDSSVRPDAQAWATRIHGLTTTGFWESGLSAYKEMTTNWIQAVHEQYKSQAIPDLNTLSDMGEVPKPNTYCFNSLVNGLSRGRKQEQLGQVFGWARNIGVEFDSYTFNPLLRLAMRDGDADMATRILSIMRDSNVKPDIATFTMVLSSLFSSSPTDDQETVPQAAIDRVFSSMRASGLQANAWSFTTLMSGLLQRANGLQAAHAILEYMISESVPRSSQVYTLLISEHFRHDPPDIATVESLWEKARMDRSVALDGTFFDKLVEGLARADELGKCTTALSQASKRGKTPSYYALTEVVLAMVRAGDWVRVEEIVARVEEEEKGQADEVRPRAGRLRFWSLVEELGSRSVDKVGRRMSIDSAID